MSSGTEQSTFQTQMQQLQDSFVEAHPFTTTQVRLDPPGMDLNVLVASTLEQRARGLIGLSLGDFDGMLFVQPVISPAVFHMQGVDQSLLLVSFAEDGNYLNSMVMHPNSGQRYELQDFKYALELEHTAPSLSWSPFIWNIEIDSTLLISKPKLELPIKLPNLL